MCRKATLSIILILCVGLFSGCRKKATENSSVYLNATVTSPAGATSALNYTEKTVSVIDTNHTNYNYTIDAINGYGQEIRLFIRTYVGLGYYPVDSTAYAAVAVYSDDQKTFKKSVYGNITVSNLDYYVRGTFTFTCEDSTKVAGKFSVYPTQ